MKNYDAPNFHEIDDQNSCDTCKHLDWDETNNFHKCWKYKIDFEYGEDIEPHHICDSFERKNVCETCGKNL